MAPTGFTVTSADVESVAPSRPVAVSRAITYAARVQAAGRSGESVYVRDPDDDVVARVDVVDGTILILTRSNGGLS